MSRQYNFGQKRKARPREEWDEFLLHVRRQFGCDSRTISSCYRVERRYLARSMKMVVYCDREPPARGEFELGYVEVHEEGLVSYEYDDWLKEWAGVPGEIFIRTTDTHWRQKADDFLAALRRAADHVREGEREKERLRRAEAESKQREQEAERQRQEAARLADEEERKRARLAKEAARRERQRKRQEERNRQRRLQRAERDRRAAAHRVEQERLAAIRLAEQERLVAIEGAKLERRRAREAQWRQEADVRRRAFAEVGIVIPSDEELEKLLAPPPPVSWRPHPGDLVLTAGGIGGLLYWLLFF